MENLPGLDTAVKEIEKYFDRQLDEIESIKNASRSLLSWSSIIITFSTIFQIFNPAETPIHWGYPTIILVLYLILTVRCILILMPSEYSSPIKPDWDELELKLFYKTDVDAKSLKLDAHLRAIEENKIRISNFSMKLKCNYYLFIFIVSFIFILSLLT